MTAAAEIPSLQTCYNTVRSQTAVVIPVYLPPQVDQGQGTQQFLGVGPRHVGAAAEDPEPLDVGRPELAQRSLACAEHGVGRNVVDSVPEVAAWERLHTLVDDPPDLVLAGGQYLVGQNAAGDQRPPGSQDERQSDEGCNDANVHRMTNISIWTRSDNMVVAIGLDEADKVFRGQILLKYFQILIQLVDIFACAPFRGKIGGGRTVVDIEAFQLVTEEDVE